VSRRLSVCSLRRAALGLVLTLFSLPAAAQPAAGAAMSPQAAVVKVCSGCHSMQMVMDTPKDYDAWHDTVQSMLDRGAQATPDELDLIMQFLFENMTPVDVNHADAETLKAVLHASQAAADTIISRRTSHPFKDLADLESSIPGLDKAALDAKKRMIFFQ
jgi:mono/diheme cytochrome c family protein